MLRVPAILLDADGGGIEVGVKVQRVNQVAVRGARLRSDEKRLTKFPQRVVETALFLEHISKLVMCLEKIRRDDERAAKKLFGFIRRAALGGDVAEVAEGVSVFRIDVDRALKRETRIIAAIEGAQRDAEDVVR